MVEFSLKSSGILEQLRARGATDHDLDVSIWNPQICKWVEYPKPHQVMFIPPSEVLLYRGGRCSSPKDFDFWRLILSPTGAGHPDDGAASSPPPSSLTPSSSKRKHEDELSSSLKKRKVGLPRDEMYSSRKPRAITTRVVHSNEY